MIAAGLRSVALVTDVPFWRRAGGAAARIAALVEHLSTAVALEVLVLPARPLGSADRHALARLSRRTASGSAISLRLLPSATPEQAGPVLARHWQRQPPDACIVEYLRLDWVRRALPACTRTLLDTHDLVSARHASAAAAGVTSIGEPTSADDELRAFDAYDHVLLIQREEQAAAAAAIGERALLVPHPVLMPRCTIRDEVRHIGLVASAYRPNVEGLAWFLDEVWPRFTGCGFTLDVFGSVGAAPGGDATPGVVRHGFQPDLAGIYSGLDIVINPVRWGAGLKIKNVEALASGLPLVTTAEGARGIRDAAGRAFLQADTPGAFADRIAELAGDAGRRRALGSAARSLALERFGPGACLQPLFDALRPGPVASRGVSR